MAGTSNHSTLRKRLRSALTHKHLADTLLDRINELQTKMNATLDKLAADADHLAVAEVTQVTVADTGATLDVSGNGLYWTLHDGANAAHYVWYNVTDGVNGPQVDPAPGGTGHQVDVLLADTAAQVATKTRTVVDGLAAFVAPAPVGAVLTVTNATAGAATDADAGTSAETILVLTQGSNAVTTIDTDFVATQAIPAANLIDPDSDDNADQDRSSLRRVMQSVLTHRSAANAYWDGLAAMQVAFNDLLAKLDAEAGTLASTDFSSSLAVSATLSTDSKQPAQDRAALARILTVAMANNSLGQVMTGGLVDTQAAFNELLAELDTGSTLGATALKVSVVDPESTL